MINELSQHAHVITPALAGFKVAGGMFIRDLKTDASKKMFVQMIVAPGHC